MELVALNPQELQTAHHSMVSWCDQQIARVVSLIANIEKSKEIAKKNQWAEASHDQRVKLYKKGLTFYRKIKEALEAGYIIVPNFPMTVFAIRTDRPFPKGAVHTGKSGHNQQPRLLATGAGRYVSPLPTLDSRDETYKDYQQKDQVRTLYWPHGWQSVMFPITLAKPQVMGPAGQAMALKLFDEVGVAQDGVWQQPKGDPIILGRLRNPMKARSAITFFIAWHFDTQSLEVKE